MPLEGVWIDSVYMNDFKQFTVNSTTFPNNANWVKSVQANGQKVIPFVGADISSLDPLYKYYQEALQQDILIESAINPSLEGGKLTTVVNSPKTVFYDFFDAKAKTIWEEGLNELWSMLPFDGLWFD